MNKNILLNIFILSSIFISSCKSLKPISYFPDGLNSQPPQNKEYRYKVGDKVSLMIYSDNPEATNIYNQAGLANTQNVLDMKGRNSSVSFPIYSIGRDSTIYLHKIGNLKVVGLTKYEIENLVIKKLSELDILLNPYCKVSLNPIKVTLLGEIKNPGIFYLDSQNPNLLDALAMGGDLSDFSRKDKIRIIRSDTIQTRMINVDLTSINLLSNEGFYVEDNDIIVINPLENKPNFIEQRTLQYISITVGVLTSLAVLINVLR